jgi:hypothetical protein
MMKFVLAISAFILAVGPNSFTQQRDGWRGIAPLYSKRADVERLLGIATGNCKCIYRTDNELVYVEYASNFCKGNSPGWRVPTDTVLSLTVTPRLDQLFAELNLDLSKFEISHDDAMTTYYANRDEGVKYAVTERGIVESVSYIPSTKDSHLRCSGFPSDDGSVTRHRPFDFYSDIAFNDEKARLDNFAAWLHQHPELIGYVVVYGGRRARAGEAQARAERAKSYLVNKRGIVAGRIITMDGGHREVVEVELYALPHSVSAPTPTPTIAPSEAQIIKEGSVKNKNRRSTRPRRN